MIQMAVFFAVLACSKPAVVTTTGTQSRIVKVYTANDLKQALANAHPGDEIQMADGIYKGKFIIPVNTNGTAAEPIVLKGSRNAVLDADNINTGYVLHLRSSYWKLQGFTLTNGLKGLMVDESRHCVIEDLKVFNIGEEAIHLRKFSSHNVIRNCDISHTGLKTPDYGEGIYIGSAKNNWATYSSGEADKCDSNQVVGNTIGPAVAAECIDIKEGTTGSFISENKFDATGITGANSADSWIDVKGNYSIIENNEGTNPGGNIFKDGYQVHCAMSGWGNFNEFKNNTSTINGAGYGFNIQLSGSNGVTTGNKVYDNNKVTGAAGGIANIPLSN